MRALRPIGHEDRLSVVDHLDELRSRLIVCGAALLVAFCVCFWQNGALIHVLNRALPLEASRHGLAAQQRQAASEHHAFLHLQADARDLELALSGARGVPAGAQTAAGRLAADFGAAARALPRSSGTQEKPITIGVGESFTTTLLVVGYFALLFSLPVLLYELYAYVIPALEPTEKRVAVPVMFSAPVLFILGAVFTYFEVLPPAVHFLQGYNSQDFQILVQAKTYYKFEMLMMLGIGLAFQVPLVLLALQRAEVISSRTLTLNWRYAVVLIAVAAAALPGVDPVTMLFETLPLIVLYLASILMLKFVEYRSAKRDAAAVAAAVDEGFDAG
jgi:sec-independent protein translocase protein TatC